MNNQVDVTQEQTGSAVSENKSKLEYMIRELEQVTGLTNLEIEEELSWKDGKTMLYEVVRRTNKATETEVGIVESYSDKLPAKQLKYQINRLYVFARQLRGENLISGRKYKFGVSA